VIDNDQKYDKRMKAINVIIGENKIIVRRKTTDKNCMNP
jgi:hypothetical protein